MINLRTIKPLDRDTIVESVKKTGRLVTVEDGFPFAGVGAEIIALINETGAFDYLRGPVQRVTSIDIPMPYAKNLEDAVVPKSDTVVKAVQKVMKFNWTFHFMWLISIIDLSNLVKCLFLCWILIFYFMLKSFQN